MISDALRLLAVLGAAFLAGWVASQWLDPNLLANFVNSQGTCNAQN